MSRAMDRIRWVVPLVGLWIAIPGTATAQTLTVTADPGALVVSTAVPGSAPDPVSDESTTYNVTTPTGAANARIAARLDTPLPPGVTLQVELEAPPGATSVGPVVLTTSEQDVVTGIPPGINASGLKIRYSLSATPAAGVVTLQTVGVTFTLVSP